MSKEGVWVSIGLVFSCSLSLQFTPHLGAPTAGLKSVLNDLKILTARPQARKTASFALRSIAKKGLQDRRTINRRGGQ